MGIHLMRGWHKRLVSLLYFGFTVSACSILNVRSDAQTATATATLGYSITGAGWHFGAAAVTDNGGNYSDWNVGPLSVTATVYLDDTVRNRYGSFTTNQPFILNPYTGDPPILHFDVIMTAQASTGSTLQSAYANATHQYPDGNNPPIQGKSATAAKYEVIGSANDPETDNVAIESDVTVTDTGTVDSWAWEVGDAGPPLGGG